MNACARCARPIEPAEPLHRTPTGDYHGACLRLETLDADELEARARRASVERHDAGARARRRLEGDLGELGEAVRR